MRWIYKLPLRLRSLFRKSRVEKELSDELRFHLEKLIEEHAAKGMTPDEARYAALRELGGVEQIKEECRDMRRVNHIENFVQDIRYALRMLARNPGFTIVAVLTLALGIGANTAVFSLVDVVLFRPLPIRRPSEVVRICGGKTRGEAYWRTNSYPSYLEYRDNTDFFLGLAAYHDRLPVNISAGKLGTDRVVAGMVTGNYFQTLGVEAARGRTISPEMTTPERHPLPC